MIRAYTRTNQHQEALEMFHSMLEKKLKLDKYTFNFAIKACTGVMDLDEGVLIHDEIRIRNLENDVYIATSLIDMYCKMGDLVKAREVFDGLPERDLATWNVMISGVSQSGEVDEALELFKSMQVRYGVEPNAVSLLNLLPAVGKLMDVNVCKAIHGYVCRRSLKTAVTNGLIDMYSKCGNPKVARRVFDLLKLKDDISWGTMMAGYAYNGDFWEVLELFECIRRGNLMTNKVSVVSVLLAAGEVRDFEKGLEAHDYACCQGVDSDIMVATSLMTMYTKFGDLSKVKELFARMKVKDLVAWSAVIAAFAQSGYPREALSLFLDMQNENLKPSLVTLLSALPACAELSSLQQGKSLHCFAVKCIIDSDTSIRTALVSMYAKCNDFHSALTVFNVMPSKDVVTWNALINGYAQIGDGFKVMEVYHKLILSGLHPDPGTMVGVLPACAILGDRHNGTCIHCLIIKYGFELDCHVKNSLIDMYAKCRSLPVAEFLFSLTDSGQDKVSWNTMIAGYMHNECAKESIAAFQRMKIEGHQPDLVTIISILPAVSYLTDLKQGMATHAYAFKQGFQSSTIVGNSLIDMYAKCGRIDYSECVFDEMRNKDTVSWNSILAAYSIHGHGDRALQLFSLMQENLEIDSVSLINILSACRHAGLVEDGKKIFQFMQKNLHFKPSMEHYACMVDLLGRAGLFDDILDLLHKMPMRPDAKVWGALLSASTTHSNVRLGELALQHLANLEGESAAPYVVLSTIYSQSERWGDAGNTRLEMIRSGLRKSPGCSWVDR
ncbi:hypothetical protein Leryth_008637 [Lithospermum erythrorhizon]|nr:hypothetical protein Leryth_008637 [Lithospermum erythrorhizon]